MNEDEWFEKCTIAWANYWKTRGIYEDTACVNSIGKASDSEVIQVRDEYHLALQELYDTLALKPQVTKSCNGCGKQFTPNPMGYMNHCSRKCFLQSRNRTQN